MAPYILDQTPLILTTNLSHIQIYTLSRLKKIEFVSTQSFLNTAHVFCFFLNSLRFGSFGNLKEDQTKNKSKRLVLSTRNAFGVHTDVFKLKIRVIYELY